MNTDETNKQIQDKFDSRKFEFNEANWEKMIPELDKLEKKKKRRVLFYFLIPGLLLLLSVFLFVNPTSNKPLTHDTIERSKREPQKESGIHEKLSATQNTNEPTEQNINTPENKNVYVNTGSSESGKIATADKASSKIETGSSNDTELSHHMGGNVELNFTKSKTKNNPDKNSGKSSDTNKNNSAEIYETEDRETTASFNPFAGNTTDSLRKEPDAITLHKKDSVIQATDPQPLVQKTDSVMPLAKDSFVKKKDSLDPKVKSLEMFAAAYLAFTPGYNKPPDIKDGFNPGLGIGIRKFFNPVFGIGSGLYYNVYSNISADPKIFQSTTHDFGYTSSFTEIKQRRLHYVKLPLTLEIRLKKNIFSIGAEFFYLVTSASEVRTYEETFGSVKEISVKKEYGYMNGFSNYDLGAVIMYSRRLTQRVYLSALINAGSMDVKNNTYFNSPVFDRNRSIQLGINYKLN